MAVLFSPFGNQQFSASGTALAVGHKIYTYVAGSSTALATYTDSTGAVAQSNPIILNSLGMPTSGQIWLTSGLSYKLVWTDASDVVIKTEDNITGVAGSASVSQWQASGLTPTYVSAAVFTLSGDQTNAFHPGRRLQFTTTAGTVYGTIYSGAYGALTTVTMTMDSGQVLDSGLSAVNYSILTATSSSIPGVWVRLPRTDVASVAGTVDLTVNAPNTDDIRITGALAITGFTVAIGRVIRVTAGGAFTLANNANIVTQTGATLGLVSGDTFQLRATAANVVEVFGLARGTRSGTKVALTSGVTADSSAIPSGVTKISGSIVAMSGNGTSLPIAQFMVGASPVATGYNGGAFVATTLPQIATQAASTGIPLAASGVAAGIYHGGFELELADAATFTWKWSLSVWRTDSVLPHVGMGTVVLTGAPTAIRLTFTNGTDAFDGAAGAFFNINYYG